MAATNDGLIESLTKSSDNDNSSNNSQVMNRKMRKTKTIGKRKLVSVKDDARRRAAREFLLGIKLDNENLHRFSPSHVLSVESVLVSKVDTVAINAESNTPRLTRTPSLRNSKDEPPSLIRQGSLKQQGGAVYKDNLSNQATPRSPYKVQSFDQNEMTDHPLSTSIGSEDRFKLLRTNSAFARIEDQYSQNSVMTGQSYIILQGTPVIMFTVLPFRRRLGTRLLSGSKSIDLSEIDLDTDQEVSLGFLLMPVWSTLRDAEFQDHELESSGKDLESWMKYIHGFWKDSHSPDKVIVHYHPDHLDNEEVFYGRRAKTMHHTSYMVSVIEYRKAESEKKDLNKRFRDVFPHIRVTLSKIRSIKKEMRQVSTEMQLDDGVLCYAFVYFEKMILMSKANKVNRKLLAGASLLVAAKFLDIERSRIKSLIHADICHAYQVLHSHGIPEEQIVVMMFDDIAYSNENPTKGKIINKPGGPDVYHDVPKDYTKSDVTPENFLNVLQGNEKAMAGIGSEKVIQSGPNDYVFVNMVDHGAPGIFGFPNSYLHANKLKRALEHMHQKNKFKQMVIYMEACESGSMFEDLPKDLNIYVTTAAKPHESSYACYYDKVVKTYLGDVYSVKWMEDVDQYGTRSQSLEKQFKLVKEETTTSHVMQYGQLSLDVEQVNIFMGNKTAPSQTPGRGCSGKHSVPSYDVPVEALKRRIESADNDNQRTELESMLQQEIKTRQEARSLMERVIIMVTGNQVGARERALAPTLKLTQRDCHEKVVQYFWHKKCNFYGDYSLKETFILANLCEMGIDAEKITDALETACTTPLD